MNKSPINNIKKPTLVLLPALMCNEKLFYKQVEKLSNYCNIIIPILTKYKNITEAAEYVLSIAPQRFFLAGISMGGYIAIEIIKLAKERVIKLCLMSTKIDEDTPKQRENRLSAISNVLTHKNIIATQSYLSSMIYNKSDELFNFIQNMNASLGIEAYINQQTLILSKTPYHRDTFKNFLAPTLVIGGINDEITPLFLLENIAKTIPNSILITLPNCGHLIPLDQPIALTALLEYFIKVK